MAAGHTVETFYETLAAQDRSGLYPTIAGDILEGLGTSTTGSPGGQIAFTDTEQLKAARDVFSREELERNRAISEENRANLTALRRGEINLTEFGERARETGRERPVSSQLATQFLPDLLLGPLAFRQRVVPLAVRSDWRNAVAQDWWVRWTKSPRLLAVSGRWERERKPQRGIFASTHPLTWNQDRWVGLSSTQAKGKYWFLAE